MISKTFGELTVEVDSGDGYLDGSTYVDFFAGFTKGRDIRILFVLEADDSWDYALTDMADDQGADISDGPTLDAFTLEVGEWLAAQAKVARAAYRAEVAR